MVTMASITLDLFKFIMSFSEKSICSFATDVKIYQINVTKYDSTDNSTKISPTQNMNSARSAQPQGDVTYD